MMFTMRLRGLQRTEMCGEYAADEDVAAPDVTEELNRLKTFGRSVVPRTDY